MGKSPGKWIKTVFFGKKSSKSNIAKDVTSGSKISSIAKAPSSGLVENPPVVLETAPQTTNRNYGMPECETGVTHMPNSEVTLLSGIQGVDDQSTTLINSADSDELNRQHEAATKAQAAFRGYLARRAFWALKGIIRLQALVRGHLVRRQAVATLQCMHAIVKFQALVRGRMVRLSDVGCEVYNKFGEPLDKPLVMLRANTFGAMKESSNPFVRKLLSSSPTAMPLRLQYDLGEPNSPWKWLERWSSSSFWVPLARSKKIIDAKPRRKQVIMQSEEIEAVRPKRNVRKVPAMNGDSSKLHSSDYEKPKRNPRKSLSHQQELVQEQPQNELEKVKRNLRKVSSSALVPPPDTPETANEKPNNRKKTSGSPKHDASQQVADHSPEKVSDSSPIQPVAEAPAEAPAEALTVDKPLDVLCDNLSAVELRYSEYNEKVENSPKVNGDQISKEYETSKESQKRRRRKSNPVKQEYPESVSQNSPTLPSYMQATESAKAKLRAQESQRFDEDEAENIFTRRHSLPASNNTKLSSPSPRMQKPLQANGKGGSKSNKSLTSSRDEKLLQTGWKR